jgi:hypothetical protein
MNKINWMDHLVNLVVVIAGITIAFGLNKCSESNLLEEDKEAITVSLQSDLQKDIIGLKDHYELDSVTVFAIKWLIDSKDLDNNSDSLNWSLSKLSEFSRFTSNSVTYEGIKNTNRLNLFDLELRNQMIQYYLLDYNQINEVERYLVKNFDEKIVPDLLNAFDITTQEANLDFIKSKIFIQILYVQLNFLNQRMSSIKIALKHAYDLESALSKN